MTGRGRVVVLWDGAHVPPAGPLLDAGALATPDWDWHYVGPETPVRQTTMATPYADDESLTLSEADVVVGVPTPWTLERVAASGARFVAIAWGDSLDDDLSEEPDVDGWPSASQWPDVLTAAVALDDAPHRVVERASGIEGVAVSIRDLLDEIRARHLPEGLRPAR